MRIGLRKVYKGRGWKWWMRWYKMPMYDTPIPEGIRLWDYKVVAALPGLTVIYYSARTEMLIAYPLR